MTALGAKKHDNTGRSIGARKTNKRTAIGGQFAPRLIAMLEAPAYRVLNQSEHRCLSRIEIELAKHGGAENGELPCRFDDFEDYGVHRHSIAPSIRALAALGFVEITQEGRAGNAEWRRPTLFRLCHRPTASMGATDEWRRIETLVQAEAIARAARLASKKQNPSGGKRTMGRCDIRTTNGQIHSADSDTTCVSADSDTTLDILERGGRRHVSQPIDPEAVFVGEPRRFAVILRGGIVRRVGVRVPVLSKSARTAGAEGAA